MLWSAFLAINVIDIGWRFRFGLVASMATLAFIALWPSLGKAFGGYLPCPTWVQERVGSRLVAGLDLRGGLRLVYTVDVDEAIKDRRARYYEEMRLELAKIYGLYDAEDSEGRPSEEIYGKLREKVEIEAPRAQAGKILVSVKPGTDPSKIDVSWTGSPANCLFPEARTSASSNF
jgi:preprotein translocase subunit SecD